MRTYKFRIYPNKEQQSKLWRHANKLNWLYNYFLNQKIEAYKTEKKTLKRFDLQAQLPTLKSDPDIKEIHSQVLQGVCKRLDQSYKDFFKRGNVGFPKFRSCRKFFGICYPQSGYLLSNNVFKTKVYGDISFKKHRNINGNVKTVHITTNNNKWFLCVTTDFEEQKSNAKSDIGIDIGLKDLVVTSNGDHIKNSRHAKYFDKQISKIQSRADKKKKGSRSWKHLTKVKQRLYDAKVRKISDFQHKVSKRLSSKYDTIYAENLTSKAMSEGKWRNLNKAIRNAKLATFINYLSYKTNNLILVNPYNTSKTCNNCGYVHQDLKLSDRQITCQCGITYDRDENAAKNVFCLGQAISGLEQRYAELVTIQEALSL